MITVLLSDGLGTTFPKSSDGRRNRGSDWSGAVGAVVKKKYWKMPLGVLLVGNWLADEFCSKSEGFIFNALNLKRDFLQDFEMFVCQDLQQNLSCFMETFSCKLSHAKRIHVYVLHLKRRWPAMLASKNNKACIRTSVYCPGNSVFCLMFGILSIFLKLFGIPIFLGFVYSLLRDIYVFIVVHI